MNSRGRATSGYTFSLCGATISYKSKLQSCVALSTAEAEYMALALAVAEVKFLRQLLGELGHPQLTPTPIGEDNNACLTIATTTSASTRTRHMDIRFHFVRDAVLEKVITLYHVPSADNHADMFTKDLRNPTFKMHCNAVMHCNEEGC